MSPSFAVGDVLKGGMPELAISCGIETGLNRGLEMD